MNIFNGLNYYLVLDTIHRGVEDTAVNKRTKISDFVNLHYRVDVGEGNRQYTHTRKTQYIEGL